MHNMRRQQKMKNIFTFFGEERDDVFLTKEEEDMFSQPHEDIMHMESKEYKMGYQNSIMEV